MVTVLSVAVDDPASAHVRTRPINRAVSSPAAMQTARKWIDNCQNNHTLCTKRGSTLLPTRVVLVQGTPRVIDRPSDPGHACGDYTALSYCWGGDQPHKLTGETLSRFCKMLPDDLPQTLKDAIKLTRELGYDYLWIDALCILQDSPTDKIREIGKMPQIYHNASVTIVAASSASSSAGFLQDRVAHGPDRELFKLQLQCNDGRRGNITIARTYDDWNVTEDEKLDPPDRRAWILQEAMLSPRRLLYGSRQMYWACQTAVEWDGPADKTNYGLDRMGLPEELWDNDTAINALRWNVGEEYILGRWGELVEESTSRGLTLHDDRLLVMSGIADRFAKYLDSQYLAGLWRCNLINDLLWYCEDSIPDTATAKSEYFAPSWSWGATYGKLRWSLPMRQPLTRIDVPLVEVVDAHVELQSDAAPFGNVKSGHLKLTGRFKQATTDNAGSLQGIGTHKPGLPSFKITHLLDITDSSKTCLGSKPVAYLFVRSSEAGMVFRDCSGLIIEKTQSIQDTWRRVGVFNVKWDPNDPLMTNQSTTQLFDQNFSDWPLRTLTVI